LGSHGKGYKVFFDRDRLDVGKEWLPQLKEALSASQHLVVIWSGHAKLSDWVTRELVSFDIFRSDHPDRRLIILNLEGKNPAFSAYQMIDELADGDHYRSGVSGLDQQQWSKVIKKITQAIGAEDSAIPISLVILTLKQNDLEHLENSAWEMIQNNLDLDRENLMPL